MSTVQQQLYTAFTNTSGVSRSFSYLPPHGKELAIGETVSIPGDIVDQLAKLPRLGKFNALQADLTSGACTVVRPVLS